MLENVTEPVRFKRWAIMSGCEVVEGGEGGGGVCVWREVYEVRGM